MTFRLTDDFAVTACNSLDEAYLKLVDILTDAKRREPTKTEITAAAMVGTLADMIRENIGNDYKPNKETVKTDAIKSV